MTLKVVPNSSSPAAASGIYQRCPNLIAAAQDMMGTRRLRMPNEWERLSGMWLNDA